jgi:ferredoxin-NADP reductase
MPARKRGQHIYAGVTALLPFAPELALVITNALSFIFGFKGRLRLSLIDKKEIAKDIYEFSFSVKGHPLHKLSYLPGQYFDWTLADSSSDLRGNRRYFTIASSPTESSLKIGVKMPPDESGSSFKKTLLNLNQNDQIFAGTLSGDFVLPKDTKRKLVFVAGGIGVTPFRSMIKYLIDTKEERDIVLFYCVKQENEIAYRDIFEQASIENTVRTVYVPADTKGFITKDMVIHEVPDYTDRTYYLSGPDVMVENYKKLFKGMGIKDGNIKTDYFPGF